MKTLSAIVLSIFMLAGVFSFQTVSANPPDAHQQAMEIHNQHHQQAHQQAMEASRRAQEEHRRYVEESRDEEFRRFMRQHNRKIRRQDQAKRNYHYAPYSEPGLLEQMRERRAIRQEAKRERNQQQ